ncbi:transporter substrate-binding domain-containing protein [Pseudomonas xanthosomatis]|uniref:transporter substrate-binding domain-containing protein n=1 Tax=Pseudomonas xanthosomatis TaxID=2842356 RepID=UPI003513F9E2
MRLAWLVVLGQLLCYPALLAAMPQPQLYGRAVLEGRRLEPSEAQLRWLWQRRELKLAVLRADNPPLDILGVGHEYEGISADYAGLIAEHLQLKVEVVPFASLDEALAAVRTGNADLLASITAQQAADAGLLLSTGYADDRPIRVAREDDEHGCASSAPLRLAMREGYRSLGSILAVYPQAQVQVYPSVRAAMGALTFGQADLYLGGALESQYQLGKGLLRRIEAIDCPALPSQPLGFASAPFNEPLHALVDAVLASIPATQHQRILQRWAGQGVVERTPLQLSEAERRWLQRHPKVRVLLNEHYPPISYRDGEGNLRGLAVDVLQRIARRTGLQLELSGGGTLERMVEDVRQGKVDLLAGITPSEQRADHLAFSRAFTSSPRVLVTLDRPGAPSSFEELQGLRLAMSRSGFPHEFLHQHHQGVQRVDADGPVDAVWRVASGRADAALVPLIGAQALTERMYPTRLKVSASLPLEPAYFTFASQRGALELQSILNKALLSLSPQELDTLGRRWRNEVIVADSFWQRYRVQVLQGFAAVALALLLALAWVRYLRRLVRVRERAEQALAHQLTFMGVMIDGTPHPIYVCDRQGRLQTCNSSYLQALGKARDEVLGQPIGLDEACAWQRGWKQVLADGQARVEDCQVVLAEGRELTLYHWMLPYGCNQEGGVIAGWVDVTERQCLQAELLAAKVEADDANQAKTRFLATMSHEIRTPMNAVLGMLELALRKAEQGVLDRLSIEVASDAARSLLELIGDILDVTRIESGHLTLNPQPLALREHVAGVVQLFEQQARAKGLQLSLELEGPVDLEVLLDPLRFKQVLANLISNAIKFTHKGGVRVALCATLQARQLALQLTIEDSGIGIPEADLAQLGGLFWQASNNQQSGRRGAGLGLSISRTLCELMGGHMHLRSTQGVGTRIDISLALERVLASGAAPEPVQQACEPDATVSLRVLVVDDYPANRLLLANQLGYLGHRACVAEHGAQALRLWLEQPFDVVISDCNMPVLDGYGLARAIRLHERRAVRARCRILGLTANALPEEHQRCRAAGMDDCLFKPVGLKRLAQALVAGQGGAVRCLDHAPLAPGRALDLSSLERLTAGDAQALAALLADLRQSNREDLQAFNLHAEREDMGELALLAHRVKGGARMVRAQALIEACEQVERSCAIGVVPLAHLDAVRLAMGALETLLARYCADATGL